MEKRSLSKGVKAMIASIIWATTMIISSFYFGGLSKEVTYLFIAGAFVHISLLTSENKLSKKKIKKEIV